MNSDSIELLQLFASEKIKYLIMGGYAVSFHTEPRYTKDIDIFIATDRQNAQAVYKALAKFGVPALIPLIGNATTPHASASIFLCTRSLFHQGDGKYVRGKYERQISQA